MSGATPSNSGFVPTTIEGAGGIKISGSGHVVVDGSSIVSVGAFQRLPGLVSTNSVAPVLFWSVPFELSEEGDLVFLMTAIVFLVNSAGPGIFLGLTFTADLDGVAVIDASSFEASPAGQTATLTLPLQVFAENVPPGPHVLSIFWQSLDATVTVQTAANEANMSIRRA